MAEPPPHSDTGDDTDVGPGPASTTGTPRWMKVIGIIGLIVIVLVVVGLLIGGGHGPRLHT
jgi:hypothetical protein